jgi:hypothetical protein
MNLDEIYTPLEEAREEIKRRWEDKELRKKVEDFLRGDIPDFLQDSPKAYLARHISSLNFELLRFEDMANDSGLEFVLSEYLDDKYISLNILKHHLGKMFFYTGIDKNGNKICTPQKVIDFNKADRKVIKDVETVTGRKLVDLHHAILQEEFPNINFNIKDVSEWVNRNGGDPKLFYPKFLALFLRNGILFENFLVNEEERVMTENVIIPAITELREKFGIKPLIVRLAPKETEHDIFWYYYNKHIKKYIHDKKDINC